jgi:hypothetical protein
MLLKTHRFELVDDVYAEKSSSKSIGGVLSSLTAIASSDVSSGEHCLLKGF